MSALDDKLTELAAKATATEGVMASAKVVVDGIGAQVAAAVAAALAAGATPAQLQAITDVELGLQTSGDSLAASVAAVPPPT